MKISNCCGASNRSNGDSDFEDIGICPECKEHCEFEEETEEYITAEELKIKNELNAILNSEMIQIRKSSLQRIHDTFKELANNWKTEEFESDYMKGMAAGRNGGYSSALIFFKSICQINDITFAE